MKQQYSKIYFEKYAALTLHHYFNIAESEILQSDRPDLRIPELAMGVEVTQAIKDDFVCYLKKEELYDLYVINPFDLKALLSSQPIDEQVFFINIDEAIKRKIEKSKNYTSYHINGLYIFTHCSNLNKEMMHSFFRQHVYDNDFYHYIFLNGIQNLFIYDMKTQNIQAHPFTMKNLIAYNQKSLYYETCIIEQEQNNKKDRLNGNKKNEREVKN